MFLCIGCSGLHRKLGTHISQVRSINLDTWTPFQIELIQEMGNAKAAEKYEACLPENFQRPHSGSSFAMERFIRDKYEARLYMNVEEGGLGGVRGRENRGGTDGRSFGGRSEQRFDGGGSEGGYDRGGNGLQTGGYQGGVDRAFMARHQDDIASPSGRRRKGVKARVRPSLRGRYTDHFGGWNGDIDGSYSRGGGGQFNRDRVLAQRNASQVGGAVSPYQRATVMKHLLDMGFTPDISGAAVEASGGDLERAVEWVLANKPSSNAPARTAESVSAPTSQQSTAMRKQPKEVNLLDFGDDDEQNCTSKLEPKSESLILEQAQKSIGERTGSSDFGAFEGADSVESGRIKTEKKDIGPEQVQKPTANGNEEKNANADAAGKKLMLQTDSTAALTSTLAALYKQGRPSAPTANVPNGQEPSSLAKLGKSQKLSPPKINPAAATQISRAMQVPHFTQGKQQSTKSAALDSITRVKQSEMSSTMEAAINTQSKKGEEEAEDPFADLMSVVRSEKARAVPAAAAKSEKENGKIESAPAVKKQGELSLDALFGDMKVGK